LVPPQNETYFVGGPLWGIYSTSPGNSSSGFWRPAKRSSQLSQLFQHRIIPPAEILLPNPSTGESKGCPGVPAIDAMLVPAAQARQVFYAGLLATISALP
jgi:hypothetical protein